MRSHAASDLLRALLCAIVVPTLLAQDGVPRPPGLVNEQVWPAPTAADWAKPVLIQWQRTWEDAVAIARETNRPILVCINMDGEIASEHYAGIRYRDPEITVLYEPYVAVIASVYRHNPRDHDDAGQRIPCPRLGGVTCGEHIAIEPILFEKFMDGRRISPRHIMVELDGSGEPSAEVYDVFYTWDTESVFNTIQAGIADRTEQPRPIVRGDKTILERIASRDSVDRSAVEAAWRDAPAPLRAAMVDEALKLGGNAPLEVLRLAISGFDLDLAQEARKGLARASDQGAVELVADAMRAQLEPAEREQLIAALDRLGADSPKARTLAIVHRGLATAHGTLDPESWSSELAGAATYPAAPDPEAIHARVEARADAARTEDSDPTARIEFAEALLAQAMDAAPTGIGRTARDTARFAQLLWDDAERAARDAERLGAEPWRTSAVIALVAWRRGDLDTAYARAEQAVKGMPQDAASSSAAAVLQLFAEARQDAIATAVRSKQDWPAEWVADVHGAYSVLARHPAGTDLQAANHYDFLQYFGTAQADRVLDEALARFPASLRLHERLRSRVLAAQGPAGLEAEYARRLAAQDAPPTMAWFAGYAALVAAEAARRRGDADTALAAYQRGIGHFETSILRSPDTAATAGHYVAMAHGGRARVLLQRGELEGAFTALQAALDRAPQAAATADGLNVTTVDTARMLRARLDDAGATELVAKLDAALAQLDPVLLEPPEYERSGRRPPRPRRR